MHFLHICQVAGKSACDTAMLDCDDDECDVEISGAKVGVD